MLEPDVSNGTMEHTCSTYRWPRNILAKAVASLPAIITKRQLEFLRSGRIPPCLKTQSSFDHGDASSGYLARAILGPVLRKVQRGHSREWRETRVQRKTRSISEVSTLVGIEAFL